MLSSVSVLADEQALPCMLVVQAEIPHRHDGEPETMMIEVSPPRTSRDDAYSIPMPLVFTSGCASPVDAMK